MDRSDDAETILQYLGSWGRWQTVIYIVYAAIFGSFGLNLSAAVYIVDTPPYHCKIPDNSTFNDTIPAKWEDGEVTWFDSCHEYINISHSNLTQPCSNGYWFDPDYGYESTVTMDFGLVCDQAILIEHSMMLREIIIIPVSVVCSYLTDKIGRKTMLLIAVFVRPIFGIADTYMTNFYVKFGVSLVGDILRLGMMNGPFLLAIEMVPSDKRTLPATVLEIMWGVGKLLCTPLLYYFRNWRHLMRATYIPTFIFYIIVFVPESITWLVRKGKYKEVKKIALQVSKVNKQKLPDELYELLDSRISEREKMSKKEKALLEEKSEEAVIEKSPSVPPVERKKLTVMDLIRTPKIRLYTLIQIFVWFVNTFVYSALALTVTYLPGDRYINFVFFAIAEIVAALLHVFLLMKYGRRIPMFLFHLIAGVGLLLTIVEVFKDQLNFNLVPIIIIANAIGTVGITASFMTIYLYTPEVFPTEIRAVAISVCQAISSVAALIAPYTRVFERNIPGMLRGICGVLAIAAGLLVLLLPETHNCPLPETVEDIENRSRTEMKQKNNSLNLDEKTIIEDRMSAL